MSAFGASAAVTSAPAAGASTSSVPGSNGIDKLSPAEAVAAARVAAMAAGSLRLRGRLPDGKAAISMDVQLQGTQRHARIGMGDGEFTLLALGTTVYVSGNAVFWTTSAGRTAARRMVGTYVKTNPTGKVAGRLMPFVDRHKLLQTVMPNGLILGKATTLKGRPVYQLTDGAGLVFDIALTGQPYPLLVEGQGGRLEFTYGERSAFARPPAGKVIEAAPTNLG